ncbi:MAG: hypothetical protein R6V77_04835 [Candidatus Cloacimonadaceae bacterium]
MINLRIVGCSLLIIIALLGLSCGTNVNITNPEISDSLLCAFGTDSTFDVITWNIQSYPKHDPETSNLLKVLIPGLKVECIAIQEVGNVSAFHAMMSQIPGWSYAMATFGDGYTRTAIAYKTSEVQVDSTATIFTGMSNPFPRPPLLMKLRWNEQEIILISLHLKAYGDNYINESNPNDEEMRRRYACQLIDQYIVENFSSSKVIVLGDWNDQIQEPVATNIFMSFLNKPLEYRFADMSIAQNLNSNTFSYPRSSSHIDHILITNELIDAFQAAGNYVKTIKIEDYIAGGWSNYYNYLSDHRPVAARFGFSE